MLISIVIPVYNVEKYLCQCIDSVLAQDYKNIEIILVNDGSTDDSGKICDKYAEAHSNITVVHKKNAGLGMARNTGLEHVTGKFVTFLDSDDYIEPDLVSNLYKGIVDNNVDMCKSGFIRITDQKEILAKVAYDNQIFEGEGAKNELLPRMIGSQPDRKDSIEMCVCAAMYNFEIIKNNNLKFPSERQYISEDLVFNIDYMQFANGACTISYVGYNYRLNVSSLTQRYREDRFEAYVFFYKALEKKMFELKYSEDIKLRLQRMFFIYMKMTISQEKKQVSKFSSKQSIGNIKRICKDECVQTILNEYPIHKIGIKQRLFLYMMKYKMAHMLYLCAQLNVL